MSDNSEFYAAMYQDDDEASTAAPTSSAAGNPIVPAKGIMNMPAMSAEIRRLQKQADEQARAIKKLEALCRDLRRMVNKHGQGIDAVNRDLSGKMDSY